MKKQQYLSYFLILIGGILAIYAQSGDDKPLAFLILGIVILMFGVYRVSSKIPSKFDKELNEKSEGNDEV